MADGGIDLHQNPGVFAHPGQQLTARTPLQVNDLSHRQTGGMFLQPLGAEKFEPDGVCITARGLQSRTTPTLIRFHHHTNSPLGRHP